PESRTLADFSGVIRQRPFNRVLPCARVVVDQRHADRRYWGGQRHGDETGYCTRNPECGPLAGQQQCGRAENEVGGQDEYEKGKVHNGDSAAVSRSEECTALESESAADVFHHAGLHGYRITRTDPYRSEDRRDQRDASTNVTNCARFHPGVVVESGGHGESDHAGAYEKDPCWKCTDKHRQYDSDNLPEPLSERAVALCDSHFTAAADG